MPRGKRRQGRPSALSNANVSQLITEIKSRREMIAQQLQDINAELAELGEIGATSPIAPRRGRGRPRGLLNRVAASGHQREPARVGRQREGLPALLHSILQGKTLSVAEMAEAAKNAGHKSKSKNFRTIVSLALLNHKPMFRRVSRGQYTAK